MSWPFLFPPDKSTHSFFLSSHQWLQIQRVGAMGRDMPKNTPITSTETALADHTVQDDEGQFTIFNKTMLKLKSHKHTDVANTHAASHSAPSCMHMVECQRGLGRRRMCVCVRACVRACVRVHAQNLYTAWIFYMLLHKCCYICRGWF